MTKTFSCISFLVLLALLKQQNPALSASTPISATKHIGHPKVQPVRDSSEYLGAFHGATEAELKKWLGPELASKIWFGESMRNATELWVYSKYKDRVMRRIMVLVGQHRLKILR